MEAKKLSELRQSKTGRQIELQMISYVENNAFFDFSDDLDGTRFEIFKRTFNHILSTYKFDEARETMWWEWGTRSGFTII